MNKWALVKWKERQAERAREALRNVLDAVTEWETQHPETKVIPEALRGEAEGLAAAKKA